MTGFRGAVGTITMIGLAARVHLAESYGPGLAYITAVTSAMEQNQLLAGTAEKNLPSLSEKILPAASSRWPFSVADGTIEKEGASIRAGRVSLPAEEAAARFTTRETINQQSKTRAEKAHRNIGSQI